VVICKGGISAVAPYHDWALANLQTTWQTEIGQLHDLITAPEDHVDLTRFSLEKYKLIVKYKTAYYSFYLPVAEALIMAGETDPAKFQAAEKILLMMGEYFQIQVRARINHEPVCSAFSQNGGVRNCWRFVVCWIFE
jgi:hypothetical protein